MNISELSLRRPVLATVVNILIVLFGVIGFSYLGIRDYPAIDPPNVNVRVSYPGANADIVESQLTEPLEKSDQWYSRRQKYHFFQQPGKFPHQRGI